MTKMSKKYICSQCEKKFTTRPSLWNHRQRCYGQSALRRLVSDDSFNIAESKTYSGTTVKSPIRNAFDRSKDIKLEGKFLSPEKSLELRTLISKLQSKYNYPVENHQLISAKRNELLRKQKSENEKHKLLLDSYPDKKNGSAKKGRSVYFLPSDIDGLWQKVILLRAEYKAGNTTTRNELVAVLDELKRQDQITDDEYSKLNTL